MSIWLISVIPAHLVEYLTGADQILDHSPPFQAVASPHLYPKCSLYFWTPKASGKKHVFSSTCDSMSECSPYSDTLQRAPNPIQRWEGGGVRLRLQKAFQRCYLSRGVSSMDDTEGPAWEKKKKASVFLTASLPPPLPSPLWVQSLSVPVS